MYAVVVKDLRMRPRGASREPIIAWRDWSFLYPNYLLDRGKFQAWEPRVRYEARCRANEEHLAPDLSCSCGIYAYNSREGVINDFPREIIGQVYLWGRVIEHEHGYRAQFAYPKSLIIYLKHLLAYRRKRDQAAQKALGRLVAEAQELGIYDE